MKGSIKAAATGLALLGAAALSACSRSEAVGATSTMADVAVAERRSLEVRAEAAGNIEPIRVVEVRSKASGEILNLAVETGDFVRRGDLLAEIDPRDVRNALAQAEADLEVARARLATAQAQRKRSDELLKANVITEQEYENTAFDEANARAQFVKAQTNLELARERMSDVRISAPMDGTIIEKSVEVGQIIASATGNVSGGTVLFRMADLAEMQVRVLVDETDIGKIRPGQTAQVTVEAYPDRRFRGEVYKIEPQAVVEQNVTMFPVLVHLDNREGLLKPGMNAEVAIEIAQRTDVVTVPNAAIVGMRDAMSAGEYFGLSADQIREALRRRPAGDGDAAPGPGGECAALVEKVRAAGGPTGLSDEDRAKMRECMQQFRQQRGGGNDGERPGVVFVRKANGATEPRAVVLGINDWDHTEVVRGLEAGEEVVLMTVVRMQQQQQQMLDRVRQRSSPFRGGR